MLSDGHRKSVINLQRKFCKSVNIDADKNIKSALIQNSLRRLGWVGERIDWCKLLELLNIDDKKFLKYSGHYGPPDVFNSNCGHELSGNTDNYCSIPPRSPPSALSANQRPGRLKWTNERWVEYPPDFQRFLPSRHQKLFIKCK